MRSSGMPVFVVHYLRKDRVGAGADILRAAANGDAPIGVEFHRCRAWQAHRHPTCAGKSPAKDLAVAPHRADLRRAAFPSEFLRAHFKTFAEMPRRKRHLLVFIRCRRRSGCAVEAGPSSIHPPARSLPTQGAYKPGTAPGPRMYMGAPRLRCTMRARHFEIRNAVEIRRRLAAAFVVIVKNRT